jgi:hypothetical protein
MATLVTAFITKINNIDFRSYEKYIELGKKLLKQAIPTICFLEKDIFTEYFEPELTLYPLTPFRLFERKEIYLYDYEPQLTDFHVKTDNVSKDTPGYMFIQCHKTEWVKEAIQENPYNTTNFVWIDFGIFHMIKDEVSFALALKNLSRKTYDRVRVASCVDPNTISYDKNIYREISWYFAGSIFGGNKESLVEFAKLMKATCIQLIETKQHIMWEVNIWYLIFQKFKTLFDPYQADHNLSILDNY